MSQLKKIFLVKVWLLLRYNLLKGGLEKKLKYFFFKHGKTS